jgi:hypothetical protein
VGTNAKAPLSIPFDVRHPEQAEMCEQLLEGSTP